MSTPSLVLHQARYDLRTFLRDPRARGFTLAMPIVMLLLFGSIFKSTTFRYDGFIITGPAYYVSRAITIGVAGTALANLVITIVAKRESGSLKRRHATPVRAWVLIGGDIATSVVSVVSIAVVLVVLGWLVYHVRLTATGIAALAAATLLGAVVLCSLAYALSSLLHSVESTGPALTLVTFMLYAISGLYFPETLIPGWLRDVAQVFPFRALALSLQAAVAPATNHGHYFAGLQLAELAGWGVVGFALATWRFSWMPSSDSVVSPSRRHRASQAA